MSWRHSMCLVTCNCSRSYIRAAATWCDWTHKLDKCFNLKHCHFIKCHHWCHRPKLCSSFVINFMGQDYWTRLLAKFVVIFYIWCCYSIVAHVHLLLRPRLQHLHPSVYYGDYSSAVDLVALRVDLVCKYRASSDTYRSTVQSSSFIDSGCYPSTEAGQDTAPHLHTVPFPIRDHHTAPCSTCVAFNCIAPWQCPRLFSDFAKHFDF